MILFLKIVLWILIIRVCIDAFLFALQVILLIVEAVQRHKLNRRRERLSEKVKRWISEVVEDMEKFNKW